MKVKKEILVAGTMVISGVSAMAQSAHPHKGVDGQRHEMPAHEDDGSVIRKVVNRIETARQQASDKGVSFAGEYIYEYTNVLEGGVKKGGSDRHLFVFYAEFDLETIFGLKGATLFAQYQQAPRETGGSLDTGDIQGFSNMEVERSLDALYEIWYEQKFADGKYRIKVKGAATPQSWLLRGHLSCTSTISSRIHV